MKQAGDIYVNFFSCTCHHAQRRCMKGFSPAGKVPSNILCHIFCYIF